MRSKNVFPKLSDYLVRGTLLLIAIVQVYPLIWMILFSLKNEEEMFGGNIVGLPQYWVWENYQYVLSDNLIIRYFINSIFVSAITIIVSSALACMAAYGVVKIKWKYNKAVLSYFVLGMMVPLHASLLPIFILLRDMKLMDTYAALILPYIAFALPMAVFIMANFLQSIPRELEESAFIDGCNTYQSFLRIVMPLVKPAIATISIFTFLSTWNELMFAITFINKTEYRTLTAGIMQMVGQYRSNWGPVFAGLTLATLPTIIIYILLSKQVQDSLTAGAIKG